MKILTEASLVPDVCRKLRTQSVSALIRRQLRRHKVPAELVDQECYRYRRGLKPENAEQLVMRLQGLAQDGVDVEQVVTAVLEQVPALLKGDDQLAVSAAIKSAVGTGDPASSSVKSVSPALQVPEITSSTSVKVSDDFPNDSAPKIR